MNKVAVKGTLADEPKEEGSFWRDEDDGEVFFLVRQGMEYSAYSLSSGKQWDNPHNTAEMATDGLTFVSRSAKITIEPLT